MILEKIKIKFPFYFSKINLEYIDNCNKTDKNINSLVKQNKSIYSFDYVYSFDRGKPESRGLLFNILDNNIYNICSKYILNNVELIFNNFDNSHKHLTQNKENILIKGYFQSYKYFDNNYDKILKREVSIKQKVECKENRFVMFDGYNYHSSTCPTNVNRRIVINFDFEIE